jgi:hypothetical protein
MITSRRSFLIGFGALIAAPAIVRATSIMPVRQMLILPDQIGDITFPIEGYAAAVEIEADAWVGGSTSTKYTKTRIIPLTKEQNVISEFKNGKWQFKDGRYDRSVIVTLRNGEQWQRYRGLVT